MSSSLLNDEDKYNNFVKEIKYIRNFKLKLNEMYISEYEEKIDQILLKKESEFMMMLKKRILFVIEDLYSSDCLEDEELCSLMKQNEIEIYEKHYKPSYKVLSEALKNFNDGGGLIYVIGKELEIKKELFNFNKHCRFVDNIPRHDCRNGKDTDFIQVIDNSKNAELSHVVCTSCLKAYLAKSVLLYCNFCSLQYYSKAGTQDISNDLQPATWEKYHCSLMINDFMRCLKCKETFYLNTQENILQCINKKCLFESDPFSIYWKCFTCTKEFQSNAKIYNPLEYKTMKLSIREALLQKNYAKPEFLPCCSENNLNDIIFTHKQECQGRVFTGEIQNRKIIICEKCKSITNYEKFIWTCPICSKRFKNKLSEKEASIGIHTCSKTTPLTKTNHPFRTINYQQETVSIRLNFNEEENNMETSHSSQDVNKGYYAVSTNKSSKENNINKQTSNLKNNSIHNSQNDSYKASSLSNGSQNDVASIKSHRMIKVIELKQPYEDRLDDGNDLEIDDLKVTKSQNTFSNYQKNPHLKPSYTIINFGRKNRTISEDETNEEDASPIKSNKKRSVKLDRSPVKVEKNANNEKEASKSMKNIGIIHPIIVEEAENNKTDEEMQILSNFAKLDDDYTVLEQIGEGTYGKIYKVLKNDKMYAMKKNIINDFKEMENALKSYKINSVLKHPNILDIKAISISHLDSTTSSVYILMDLALSDWDKEIKNRKNKFYSEDELIIIIKQLSSALSCMQKLGISHRDIKPQNVLCFDSFNYKMADFGEAEMDRLKRGFKKGVKGTELFMSPILYRAHKEFRNEDEIVHNAYKSDCFSFGLCFLYAATLNINTLYDYKETILSKSYTSTSAIIFLKSHLKLYSTSFVNLLYKMLSPIEKDRLDFIELEDYLSSR